MTEAYHANSTGAASCDDEGAAAAPGAGRDARPSVESTCLVAGGS